MTRHGINVLFVSLVAGAAGWACGQFLHSTTPSGTLVQPPLDPYSESCPAGHFCSVNHAAVFSDHDRDVIARNTKFNSARSVIRHDHPDIPRTIEFPEIATNPVLWDFTLHSVLRGERRTWTWGYTRYVAVAPTITTTGTGTVYPITAGTIATDTTIATGNGPSISWAGSCSNGAYGATIILPSIIPAASGGPP